MSNRLWAPLFFCAVLAALTTSRVARADEPVVIVAEDVAAPLVQRLTTELTNGGYHVEVVSAAVGVDFSTEAALRHARVVLRVAPLGDSVDLWLADGVGQSVRFRERIASNDADVNVLAIRAHEAIHGKLLPLAPDTSAAAHEPPPKPVAPVVAPRTAPAPIVAPPRRASRFAASFGPSVLESPGGGVAGDAALGFAWLATERLSVDAIVRIPVLPLKVDAPEGSAQVSLTLFGAGASFAFAAPAAAIRPSIGAGLALAWSHVDGVAASEFVSHSDDRFAALPYARVSTSFALNEVLRLRVDAIGGVFLPNEKIVFAGSEVATVGAPLLDGSIAVEALW